MKKLLLSLFLLPSLCYGTPSITGYSTITHDQSFTVTGTDFTVKTTAAPIKFEDFDSGSDGSTIAGSAAYGNEDCSDCWSDYKALSVDGAEDPKYSNLNNRANSVLNARFHYVCDSVNYSDSILCWEGSATITDKVFVSFWIRMDWGTTTDTSYQAKMFWVGESGLYEYPGFRLNAWQNASTTNDSYFLGLFLDVAGTQSNPTDLKVVGDNVNPLGEASWTLVQIWVQGASDSSGEVHVRFYDPYDDNQRTALDYTGITLSESGWKDFVFGRAMTNVDDPANLDTTHYYDDIYIDNSWARVEIGNASTYSACTNLEVCPATSWNNTSITATAKIGSLGSSSWLYVTDINGVVNETGYSVTVGETPAETTGVSLGGGVSLSGITIQ